MSDWPIALSTGCLSQLTFCESLPLIREAGFNLLEVCSLRSHLDYTDSNELEQAVNLLEELHLEARSFHAPFGPDIDITSPELGRRTSSFDLLAIAARAALRLGAAYFVLHPGPERHDLPRSERLERLANASEVLNQLAVYCRELGLRLVLETMLPHLFVGSLADLLWMLGSIRVPEVDLCLDTGHASLGGNLALALHRLGSHLSVIHAHDNLGRFDDHLPPGRGRINWPAFVGQLSRQGFRGTIVLELANCSSHPAAGLAGAREAMRFLHGLSRRTRDEG